MAHIQKRNLLIIFVLFYLLMLFLHFNIDPGELGNDDLQFMRDGKTYSYQSWITQRYETWSGRVSVETVLYFLFHQVMVWRFINPLFFILLAYTISRLVGGRNSETFLPLSVLTISLIGLINSSILLNGAFWITGSINYLWTVALGLFSILPFSDAAIFGHNSRPTIFHMAAGIFAAFGQEQVALFILGFETISLVIIYFKTRRIPSLLLLQLVTTAVSVILMIGAPGNTVRLHRAVGLAFPGFDHFSLINKILYGLQFLLPSFVVTGKLLLLLLWVAMLIYFLRNKIRAKPIWMVTFSLVAGLALLLLTLDNNLENNAQRILFNFANLVRYDRSTASMHLIIDSLFYRSAASVIFWSYELFLVTPLALHLIYKDTKFQEFIYLSIYIGAISVIAILFFSPTIMSPGFRVLLLPSILFIVIILSLVRKIYGEAFLISLPFKMGLMIFPLIFFLPYYLILNNFSLSKLQPTFYINQTSTIHCNIDSFDQDGDYLVNVTGWAFAKGENTMHDIKYIIFQSPDRINAFTTRSYSRPDVTQNLDDGSNYNQSGFQGKINILDLPKGNYKVGIALTNSKNHIQGLCWTEKTINLIDYTHLNIQ